jgi:hypothetical protein
MASMQRNVVHVELTLDICSLRFQECTLQTLWRLLLKLLVCTRMLEVAEIVYDKTHSKLAVQQACHFHIHHHLQPIPKKKPRNASMLGLL